MDISFYQSGKFLEDLITPAEALISRDVLTTLCIWSAGGQRHSEIKKKKKKDLILHLMCRPEEGWFPSRDV